MKKFSTRKELHSVPAPTDRPFIEIWHETTKGFGARIMKAAARDGEERRVYLARFSDDGKDKKQVLGTFEELSYDDALRKALDLRSNVKYEKATGKKALPTLGRALEEYLEDREDKMRAASAEDYKKKWAYLAPHQDDNVLLLDSDFWLNKHAELRKVGRPTADAVLRLAHAVYQSLVDDERLTSNPVRRVAAKKEIFAASQPRQSVIARADMPKLWAWIHARAHSGVKDLVLLTLFTGLRDAVVGSLRWDQVDFDGRLLHVPAETRGNKAGVRVWVPVCDWLYENVLLPRHQARLPNNPWVIPSHKKAGKALSEYRGTCDTMRDEINVYIHPHMLRKTFATIALQAVGSDLIVSRMLTHSVKSKGKSDSAAATGGYLVQDDELLREAFNKTSTRILEYAGVSSPPLADESVKADPNGLPSGALSLEDKVRLLQAAGKLPPELAAALGLTDGVARGSCVVSDSPEN